MGRKIPARKHRGVKDPFLQLARRDACPTINAPPSNPDDQELPKSIQYIQHFSEMYKNKSKDKKKRQKLPKNQINLIDSLHLYDKDPILPGMRRKNRNIPRVIQKPNETDEAYLSRFSAAAQEFISEIELENKHDVVLDTVENSAKPEETKRSKAAPKDVEKPVGRNEEENNGLDGLSIKKRRTDDIVFQDFSAAKKKMIFKRTHKGITALERSTKPNKRQRQKLRKLQVKKEEHPESDIDSSEEKLDFTVLKDEVKFGEVVHRPPQFTKNPRGAQPCSKPGTKNLLLKEKLNEGKPKEGKKASDKYSNAQKYFLEKERLRVVQAYRDLKAKKMKSL